MINGFNVSGQAALHFTYNNNNNNGGLKTEHNNNNNNGILKIQAAEMELEGGDNMKWFNLSADAKDKNPKPEAISKSAFKNNQTTSTMRSTPSITSTMRSINDKPQQRTEDQESAFRRIEDVHNYAKLQDCCSDIDDDDDDDDVDDDEDDNEGDANVTERNFNHLKLTLIQREDTEEPVDVVTVPQHEYEQEVQGQREYTRSREPHDQSLASSTNEHDNTSDIITPEHHARRPMNAFLIFCKRHRAIVKERYKTFENRAITKILGDWWAALDDQEKQCFTDLAQQNKDAFFNANPNFKWYKLPAPPLRTLNTRPSNTISANMKEQELGEDVVPGTGVSSSNNYFQLADVNQMGELSSLLQVQRDKEDALQQALSETSQFLSAHMPPNTIKNRRKCTSSITESSPSNSSEEDALSPVKKMKTTRSCKGKIYQELMNSGQIAAITKKNKRSTSAQVSQLEDHEKPTHHIRSVSESSCNGFDLEEKIKELPALSLDIYLQRKRSTKKKKKFTSNKKSRNSHSGSGSGGNEGTQSNDNNGSVVVGSLRRSIVPAVAAAAVGSQKRKARKESITRRDVSAIEQEVASILPLTINGCYYFNQTESIKTPPAMDNSSSFTSSSPMSSASSPSLVGATVGSNTYDVTSSTSDLLILAEVAANRTEHQQENSFATRL